MYLLPTFLSIQGVLFGIFKYSIYIEDTYKLPYYNFGKYIYYFFTQKWYFDLSYNAYIIKLFLNFCYNFLFKLVDRGFYEFTSSIAVMSISNKFAHFIQNINNISIIISLFKFIVFFVLLLFSFLYLPHTCFRIICISIYAFIIMPFLSRNNLKKK